MLFYSTKQVHSQNDNFEVGRKAAIVILNTSETLDASKKHDLTTLSYAIAMTIVASDKSVFYESEINPVVIENFKDEQLQQVQRSGKPEAIIQKIVEGQLKKYYQANTICHQPLISPQTFPWLAPNLDGEEITVDESIQKTAGYLSTKIDVPYYKVFNLA